MVHQASPMYRNVATWFYELDSHWHWLSSLHFGYNAHSAQKLCHLLVSFHIAANADRCLQEDDPRHPLHGQRPARHRLPSRNSFLDSTEALNTSKQDARTTLWVEEWNALGERSTEWRDRGIIPNEHLASGTDEPWSTWRSLNRLRVQKGRCRAISLWWKCGSSPIQMYVTVGRDRLCLILWHVVMPPIARGQTWLFQPLPVSTVPNTGRNQSDSGYRGLDEEEDSTSLGSPPPGYCHSPVIVVKNVDIHQPILLHISWWCSCILMLVLVRVSRFPPTCPALFLSYCLSISTSYLSIPARSLLHSVVYISYSLYISVQTFDRIVADFKR